ncbi:N-acetyl-gamma-glutamyl-phosphate reductase [bacterium]|nr:N-acetyl-gamma-glutamyl-phosphate reductase [bacterium]
MEERNRIGVAILGGTGFGAGELLRLLLHHPDVAVTSVTSRKYVGKKIDTVHPNLSGFYEDLTFSEALDFDLLKSFPHKVVFSALPHSATGTLLAQYAETFAAENTRIIDLSGAHRLHPHSLHEEYYPGVSRNEEFSSSLVYGLSEINSHQIEGAAGVANPGCLATASILSIAPIAHLLQPEHLVFDTKTGSSGSGKELKETTHHPLRHNSFTAYKPLCHQHEPEVMACLTGIGLPETTTSFVAQSLPTSRGIYVTTHLLNRESLPEDEIEACYLQFAEKNFFIRIREKPPIMQNVIGTNFCDISFTAKGRQLLVMAAIDNLGKGMAGQAIQNMNLMTQREATKGLSFSGIRPY